MFGLGFMEMFVIGVVAILLFGRNLPEVARSAGRMYRDFRSGLSQFTDQINLDDDADVRPSHKPSVSYDDYDDYEEATAPKFEPPKREPVEKSA